MSDEMFSPPPTEAEEAPDNVHQLDQRDKVREGLTQSHKVRRYLELVAATQGTNNTNTWTVETLRSKLAKCEQKIQEAPTVITRLQAIQERITLTAALEAKLNDDTQQIIDDFIEVAKDYSERVGISYAAYREMAVPVSVLNKAGMYS